MKFVDKDLISVQEARILLENADNIKLMMKNFSQEKLDTMLNEVHSSLINNFNEITKLFVSETGYGNVKDEEKILKILSTEIINRYRDMRCIGKNKFENTIEIPLGVIVGLVSVTNPLIGALSIIYATLKSGNALILSTEVKANKCMSKFIKIISEITNKVGYPKGVISFLETSTEAGNIELINSSKTSMIINVGLEKYLENPRNIRYIYGSNGASPVFIERTADIEKAVSEIVESRSFNNGILPGVEQFLIVDNEISLEVREKLKINKAYFLKKSDEEKLLSFLFRDGKLDEEYIGKSAIWLANKADLDIPKDTKVLISEQKYISNRNYYSKELKLPILILYIEKDWLNACERCIELLLNDKVGHTLSIYSNNENIIEQFIITKPTGRILVNTSSAFGGMGLSSDIFPSAVLGALVQKKGMSSKNLEARDLVYKRSVGRANKEVKNLINNNYFDDTVHKIDLEKLEKVLCKLIKKLHDK